MIKGEKINLRVIQEKDLDTYFMFWSDIENRGDFFPISLSSASDMNKTFQETGFWTESSGKLLITDKEERIVGSIWYFKSVPYFDALEIGYILFDRKSRGKGFMTEALSLLVRFLFETKKIYRIQLTVVVGNTASKKVAEKCGFTSEGIARKAVFLKGKNLDLEWFSLLRDEFERKTT